MHFMDKLTTIKQLRFVLIIFSSLIVMSSGIVPNASGEQNTNDGIWDLSNLDENYTKNECFVTAVNLATTITESKIGQEAFSKVSKSGESLTKKIAEINDRPQIQVKNLGNNWAQYEGDMGINENTIYLDKERLTAQLNLCQDPDKKNSILLHIAVMILHETVHWSDNMIKYPHSSGDTLGEEGRQFEKDVFGGVISLTTFDGLITDKASLLKNGQILDNMEIQRLSDPNHWM